MCEYAATGSRVMTTPAWLVKALLEIAWQLRLSPLYKWVYGTADKDSFVSTEKIQSTLGWSHNSATRRPSSAHISGIWTTSTSWAAPKASLIG